MAKEKKVMTLDDAIAAIQDNYGKESIHPGSSSPLLTRLPSGSYGLDFIMGGGYPLGRMTRLWGGEASGKTLAAYNAIANAQNYVPLMDEVMADSIEWAEDNKNIPLADNFKRQLEQIHNMFPEGKMSCAYINVEQQFDPSLVKRFGVNIDDLLVVEDNVIENIGAQLETLVPFIDMFVIDSASAAISLSELTMEPEEQRRGTSAKAWGLWFRRIHNRMSPKNTGIVIDQARIDMKNGNEYAPGGKSMDHDMSMTLHFRKGSWLYLDKDGELTDNKEKRAQQTITGDIEPDGLELTARNEKSKVGVPLRKHRMRIDFKNIKIDQEYEIIAAGIFFKLIHKAGSWYTLVDEEGEVIGKKCQGTSKLARYLRDEQQDHLKKIIRTWRNSHEQ